MTKKLIDVPHSLLKKEMFYPDMLQNVFISHYNINVTFKIVNNINLFADI